MLTGEGLAPARGWASSPWDMSIVHVLGLAPLTADSALFFSYMLTRFCLEAMSPSLMQDEEQGSGYMVIAEHGR